MKEIEVTGEKLGEPIEESFLSDEQQKETEEPVKTPEQEESTAVAEPEETAASDDEVVESKQEDFTMIEYVVVYQMRKHGGFIFDGEDKVVSHDPTNAAMRVLEGIVSRDPDIAHIRAIEVRIPSTDDHVTFFKKTDVWPPDPNIGPYISQEPARIDKRSVTAVVQVEKRTIVTKDKNTILQLSLRISGNVANTVERQLTYFRSGEDLLLTLVPYQTDIIAGKKAAGGVDIAGEGEDTTVVNTPEGEAVELPEEPSDDVVDEPVAEADGAPDDILADDDDEDEDDQE